MFAPRLNAVPINRYTPHCFITKNYDQVREVLHHIHNITTQSGQNLGPLGIANSAIGNITDLDNHTSEVFMLEHLWTYYNDNLLMVPNKTDFHQYTNCAYKSGTYNICAALTRNPLYAGAPIKYMLMMP